jgi:hypothetical protein
MTSCIRENANILDVKSLSLSEEKTILFLFFSFPYTSAITTLGILDLGEICEKYMTFIMEDET